MVRDLRMLEIVHNACSIRGGVSETAFELVLNELRLCTTLCRMTARNVPAWKRQEYENMARKRLGASAMWLQTLDLTPEQVKRFEKAFRELTACLPIRPIATVTSIDSIERSA